jgi:hypothetical protein
MHRARSLVLLGLAGALVLAGCGLGSGEGTKGTSLTVTLDFGRRTLIDTGSPKTDGEDTVMRLLQRNAKVTTRYGGGFVQSIDGQAGSADGPAQQDWMYYVNGVEAPEGAASTDVHDGDRVWWDRHTWAATQHIPAVVGSFPEPFVHGIDGKKYPVLVECAVVGSPACNLVSKKLGSVGAISATNRIGASFTQHTIRVLIGPWAAVRSDPGAKRLEQGPAASGVFAKPSASGTTIQLLHGDGSPGRTLGAGAGLVAATAVGDQPPTWVITGTDAAGQLAAAGALDEGTLKHHFALAISGGRGVNVPEAGP